MTPGDATFITFMAMTGAVLGSWIAFSLGKGAGEAETRLRLKCRALELGVTPEMAERIFDEED